MRISAYAKINWSLAVLGRRPDGYHLLDTLMQTVSLHDTIELAPADTLRLSVQGPVTLPVEGNLVLRAATLLRDAYGIRGGAAIRLIKRIPTGAGLGGGSADAAAALRGLRALWRIDPSLDTLTSLALQTGADVPFCLVGGLARVGGIGEIIAPIPVRHVAHLVIVQPAQSLSTPQVFGEYDRLPCAQGPDIARAAQALVDGDLPALAAAMGNDLQEAAIRLRPGIAEGLKALTKAGALAAVMTGSGAAVLGLFAGAREAAAAARACRTRWRHSYAAHTVPPLPL